MLPKDMAHRLRLSTPVMGQGDSQHPRTRNDKYRGELIRSSSVVGRFQQRQGPGGRIQTPRLPISSMGGSTALTRMIGRHYGSTIPS